MAVVPSKSSAQFDATDFESVLAHPTRVYEEGLRFFRGKGLMNESLKRLAADLNAHGIAYSLIGAVALNQHGYRGFTEDIDILMTAEGLNAFTAELVGRGYRSEISGARKKFRSTSENVPIEIIVSGEYPGDGKPKPIAFPKPDEHSVLIDGISTITLEKLVELKLASGMTGLGRRKDLADIQELIRTLQLDTLFADKLHPSVRPMYLELLGELEEAKNQKEQPGREG